MKTKIQLILKKIFKLFSIIFSYTLLCQYRNFIISIHTYWISSEFKVIGKDSSIGLHFVLRGGKYISIGNKVAIGNRGILTAWDSYLGASFSPEIIMGNNISIGEDSHITAINRITIGNNVLIGKKVTITDNSHGKADADLLYLPPIKRPLYSKGPVTINDGVWIGDKVTILAGVTIGENAIIGANAVVTKNILANSVAGGNPAKVIKTMI